jgi:hypothetical protein
MTSEVEAFRTWLVEAIDKSTDKELLGVFGFDTFDPTRQAKVLRRQLRLLLEGRHDELESLLLRSRGEDEAHDLAIRLEDQMRKSGQSLEEIVAIFLRIAQDSDAMSRDSVKDAADVLEGQLQRPLAIRPTRRKQVAKMLLILREALRNYPET